MSPAGPPLSGPYVAHFITLHHRVQARGEATVREPDKVSQWRWVAFDQIPEPRFAATASLLDSGWRPV